MERCFALRSESVWIPLADGTRLSAHIWHPDGKERVPAILEYLPYRHRDGTWDRDALTYPWLAAQGYAGVRVDIRGSGESDGLLSDEYTSQEQEDALEVIAWIAAQPWCTGAVGMMGISWGGFNALQVAARRPPALRAIVTVCSTDDRYADDVHYMGGALLTSNFGWAFALQGIIATPPDPAVIGEGWREMWRERLEAAPLYALPWLRHLTRDAYWRHGSVCEDWDAIACPVYAMGGWTDAYTNAIPRMLTGLGVPRAALIGPWAHKYPHIGVPGPAAGFLQESRGWWDRWLKGTDTAAPPFLRVWMMESVRPAPMSETRPGRWIEEPSWPPQSVSPRMLFLTQRGLGQTADGSARTVCSPQHLGATGGNWCPFGLTPDDADDQREDDALSEVWDSPPLTERTEILGAPELTFACDARAGHVIARLCDVHPDGASLRVSYGVVNLAQHSGGTVRLKLNDAAFAFPPGHRVRVAISTAYWPIVWPAAIAAPIALREARLTLPVRRARATEPAIEVPPAETAPPAARTVLRAGRSIRERGRDIGTGEWFWRAVETPIRFRIDALGTEIGMESRTECRIRDDDPLSATMTMDRVQTILRGAVETRVTLSARIGATAEAYMIEALLEAFDGPELVCRREWRESVAREGK